MSGTSGTSGISGLLSKDKATEIIFNLLYENFGDRKETIREYKGNKIITPGFPEKLNLSMRFREDLGLDSLDLTELAMDAEERYAEITGEKEIYFDADVLKSISTIEDAVDFFVQAVKEIKSMTPEEYRALIKQRYNFSEMGLSEKEETGTSGTSGTSGISNLNML